jgi:hypothetical protein
MTNRLSAKNTCDFYCSLPFKFTAKRTKSQDRGKILFLFSTFVGIVRKNGCLQAVLRTIPTNVVKRRRRSDPLIE